MKVIYTKEGNQDKESDSDPRKVTIYRLMVCYESNFTATLVDHKHSDGTFAIYWDIGLPEPEQMMHQFILKLMCRRKTYRSKSQ